MTRLLLPLAVLTAILAHQPMPNPYFDLVTIVDALEGMSLATTSDVRLS
jgi:hypothetical protein